MLQDAGAEAGLSLLVRTARAAERLDIARVHIRSWQAGYRGLIDDDFLDELRPEHRAGIYEFGSAAAAETETIVAVADNEIVGFAAFGRTRDEDVGEAGEIYALYVAPDRWGSGIGGELLLESRRRLQAAGFGVAVLWVLRDNTAAERFYEADGWSRDGACREEDPYGPVVEVRRFRRRLAD